MSRICSAAPLVALVFTSLVVARAGAQDPSSAQRLIEIDAVAVDRDGRPVADLRAEDLEVWIGGLRVPIESLEVVTPESANAGRVIVLLLDDITLDPTSVGRGRTVATRFVTQMGPGDQMAVVTLNGSAMPLTADQARLRARIEAWRMPLGITTVDRVGEQLLRVVDSIARSLTEVPGKRKTIVAIGSGWLLDTPIPPAQLGARDLRREWDDAVRSLAVSDTAYYVIDPRGVGATRIAAGDGFASETGGHAFTNTNDLDGAADRILAEAARYYVIRVEDPPVGRTSKLRELDVRAKRDGLTIRARRVIPGGS
jgi:VWFA-related protein